MPNVEFECPKCGNQFTMKRQMVDPDSEVKCPKCGTRHPKRVLKSFMSKLIYAFSSGAHEGEGACANCNG
jgi:putative FmdB family regulatory protein